jgi:hypothetical protein
MKRLLRLSLLAFALASVACAAPAHVHAQRDTARAPAPARPTPTRPTPTRPTPAAPRPVPADTDTTRQVRRDTAGIPPEAVRGDTLPGAKRDTTPPDSTIAAPSFPEHPLPPSFGFSDATWFFGPRELQYFQGLSLADLLDRIPGLVTTRTGGFGRPLGVSPFAAGGGRFRVFVDGYEIRAMNAATPDLQRIPVVNLQSVRIQRGMDEIRVDVTSLRLADIRPFAQIEGADGDLGTRFLRAIFTSPIGRRWVGEVALDLDQSGGYRRAQPFSETSTIERLSYAFSSNWGVQAEYRLTRSNLENRVTGTAGAGVTESIDRSDAILRARGLLLGRIHLEAMVGRGLQRPAGTDTVTGKARDLQAEGRITLPVRFGMLSAGARLDRSDVDAWAPDQSEVWGRLDLTPGRFLAATGEVRQLTLGGVAGLETTASLRAGPWEGISLFGQLAAGRRGLRVLRDSTMEERTFAGLGGHGIPRTDSVDVAVFQTLTSNMNGLRAGVELNRGLFHLGAAVLHHDVDQAAPYGFDFDRFGTPQPGLAINGVEGYASVPLLVRQLTLSGWVQHWFNQPNRVYLPTNLGRAAVTFNGVYKEGNLEPTIRLEMVAHDQSLSYDVNQFSTELVPRYAVFNWYVQVRIIDIRIFWRYENAFGWRGPYDITGSRIPFGRALYGLRWFFRN